MWTTKAVIFDMDGLLINTEDIYSKVTQIILDKYGKTFTWEIKMKMMGLPQEDAAKILCQSTGITITPEEYLESRNSLHKQYFQHCELLPGVEQLVKHLKKHNIPIAVATSSYKDPFLLKTSHLSHLFNLFDQIVLGDDNELKRGKPFEDIFVLAAKRLNLDCNKNIIVFEDSLVGIEAANRGHFNAIWVPHPQMPIIEHSFKCTHINSILDFNPEKFGLPPY